MSATCFSSSLLSKGNQSKSSDTDEYSPPTRGLGFDVCAVAGRVLAGERLSGDKNYIRTLGTRVKYKGHT